MSEVEDENQIIETIAFALGFEFLTRPQPISQHTSTRTGKIYYEELMQTRNDNRFRSVARMDKRTFRKLLLLLEDTGKLQGGPKICPGEKLMIFLFALTGHSNRQTCECWQHSGDSVSKCVHEVICAIMNCSSELFVVEDANPGVQARIQNNANYSRYFQHCIGALDGTHIPAVVGADAAGPFRDRKGNISQNVLAVVNFEMNFTFVLAGWEGSAHEFFHHSGPGRF